MSNKKNGFEHVGFSNPTTFSRLNRTMFQTSEYTPEYDLLKDSVMELQDKRRATLKSGNVANHVTLKEQALKDLIDLLRPIEPKEWMAISARVMSGLHISNYGKVHSSELMRALRLLLTHQSIDAKRLPLWQFRALVKMTNLDLVQCPVYMDKVNVEGMKGLL